jgi:hypothetical protein
LNVNLFVHQSLLVDSFEFDEAAETCDDHAFGDVGATRKRWLVIALSLPFAVIPNLAIRAVAVPAKVSVRDRFQRKKLEASEQPVILRHFNAASQNFYRDQFFVRVKKVVVYHPEQATPMLNALEKRREYSTKGETRRFGDAEARRKAEDKKANVF